MSQPPAFNRSFSFTNFQAASPTTPPPGSALDGELNNAKRTLDAVLRNLALIQRDDGAIANASVGFDQLKTEVPLGFNVPVVWTTATAYTANSSTVFNGSGYYRCLVTHTSGTFATDLAALKWQLIVDLSAVPLVNASQIAVTPSGLLTTNAQTSLQALDAGKAATSHGHTAAQISDSTAAGRAMLVAANLAAQQTLLGLGSLAYLNTVNVTTISANLAFTPSITGALLASANDWTPTGWATATVVKITTPANINITGFAATTDGDIKILHNTSNFVIAFNFESSFSVAANRIAGGLVAPNFVQLASGASVAFMYDGTNSRWRVLFPVTLPQISTKQVFTSGTAVTYTTPSNCRRIRIRMVGGGAGGGQGANAGTSAGGGSSTFSGGTLTAGGGGGANSGQAGGGGTATNGNILNAVGGCGGSANGATNGPGGIGGSSYFGGAGAGSSGGTAAGGNAAANTGAGGGGGSLTGASQGGAGGGGSGGYVEHIISTPAATYTYTVGAGGAGTTGGGADGGIGGNGAAGIIIVEEDY